MTWTVGGVVAAGRGGAVFAAETDLVREERKGCEVFRERVVFGLGDTVRLCTIKGAIIAPQMITPPIPKRYKHRHSAEAMAAMQTEDG
jgi:hypothetical protein